MRARLETLRNWKDAGLIPQRVYEAEVQRTLRGTGEGAGPDSAPEPGLQAPMPAEFPLPQIDWTDLGEYFKISGTRTGVYAYQELEPGRERAAAAVRPSGAVLRSPAIVCNLKATQRFLPDIARFTFRGYGADGGLLVPATPVAFDRRFQERSSEYWPVGGEATGYLPFYEKGLDPSRVTRIRVSVRNVADFRLPEIAWGDVGDYFEVSDPRTGIYKYVGATFRKAEGGTSMVPRAAPAIVFDVQAKKAFLAKVAFQGVGYDAQGNMVSPNIGLEFDVKYRKRSGVDWGAGDRAVAYMPFKQPNFDPAVVARLEIKITDPYDFPLPQIDWTVLRELFKVSNVRAGPYYASEEEVVPALVFDVEARFAFTLGTASFSARLYDEDNKTVGSTRAVMFEREFFVRTTRDAAAGRAALKSMWPKGGRATAFIPFRQVQSRERQTTAGDVDPAAVKKIVIFQSYGQIIH